MQLFRTIVLALLVVASLSFIVAAETPNLSLTIAKVDKAPVIDGILDDAAWVTASQNGSKAVIDMAETGAVVSPFPWVAYMAYDDTALYIAYVTYTQNSDNLVDNIGIWSNDHVELFIAPAGQSFRHLGWDIAGSQNATAEQMSTIAIRKTGIQAIYEVAIPFEKLGATPVPGAVWTGNLTGLQVADSGQWMCWNPSYGRFANELRFGSFTFGR